MEKCVRAFTVSPSWKDFVFETTEDLAAVMDAFDRATVVDKKWIGGKNYVVKDEAEPSYNVSLLPYLTAEMFVEMKEVEEAKKAEEQVGKDLEAAEVACDEA